MNYCGFLTPRTIIYIYSKPFMIQVMLFTNFQIIIIIKNVKFISTIQIDSKSINKLIRSRSLMTFG